jgi:ribonuclease P protein component
VAINKLFIKGQAIYKHPIKIIWIPGEWDNNHAVKVVISVSKRNFKRAIDRNRVKRVLRECFRLNKYIIERDLGDKKCLLALVYTGKELPNYKGLEPIIIHLFQRLSKDYENFTG